MYELRTFNSVLQSVTVGGYYSRHENTRTMFEICSKLERTVEELYRRSGNFILALNRIQNCSGLSSVALNNSDPKTSLICECSSKIATINLEGYKFKTYKIVKLNNCIFLFFLFLFWCLIGIPCVLKISKSQCYNF